MQCKKKMAMYIRLSMEDEDIRASDSKTESNSVGNQRKLLLDYYHSHPQIQNYEIIEFCDDGYSGTNFKRPRFMDMMELVRQREIHCIMVKDLSRFGREYLEVGAYLELILPLFGTRFISVNDGFDSSDYVGTTGGLELALRNLINGLYSKDLSIKVRSAIKTRNRRGQYWGGGAFYGYLTDPKDKHKLIVDEDTRSVVEDIFEYCIDGFSTTEIAQKLNEKGIVPPVTRKKQLGYEYNGKVMGDIPVWHGTTVCRILKDERYTGKMISGTRETVGVSTGKMRKLPKEEWVVVNGTHEAIISQEIFYAAGVSLKKRVKAINSNTAGQRKNNLFVCGYCGRKLQKSNGKITHLFCMQSRDVPDSECACLHEDIEKVKANTLHIVRMLAKLLIDQHVQKKASGNQEAEKLEKQIESAKWQMERLQSGKLDLYEDYRTGKITKEQFLSIQTVRQSESDKLASFVKEQSMKLEELKNRVEQMNCITGNAKDIWILSEYRPEVIRKLVEKVSVFSGGRIELNLICNDSFVVELMKQAETMAS